MANQQLGSFPYNIHTLPSMVGTAVRNPPYSQLFDTMASISENHDDDSEPSWLDTENDKT